MKNALKSICVIISLIIIGGILTSILVAIFEPTYTYPSIDVFIISFLFGGVAFTAVFGFLVSMICVMYNVSKYEKRNLKD